MYGLLMSSRGDGLGLSLHGAMVWVNNFLMRVLLLLLVVFDSLLDVEAFEVGSQM